MAAAPPPVLGIHHLKFPVSDLSLSLSFYTRIFGATHLVQYDHFSPDNQLYAVILSMPGWDDTALELRLDPENVDKHKGFDPVTWCVDGRKELVLWKDWLEENKAKCSEVLMGVKGWVLVCEEPDGRFLRLYTREEHEITKTPDRDAHWLGN